MRGVWQSVEQMVNISEGRYASPNLELKMNQEKERHFFLTAP